MGTPAHAAAPFGVSRCSARVWHWRSALRTDHAAKPCALRACG